MEQTQNPPSMGFSELGLAPRLLEALLKLHITEPTPIQQKAIPIALDGKDVIGIAQTGTGKTFAFGLPMIQRLARTNGRGLIVVPTRELALQVNENLMKVGQQINLRTAVLIGGASMHKQLQDLGRKPHVLIVTPGRLIDHLEQKTVNLKDISVLVLDEADRMLDMGFMPQIKQILSAVPKERQTLLFSATMPPEIVRIASQHMAMPVSVEIAPAGTAAEKVTQEVYFVGRFDKPRLLEKLLKDNRGSILVFSRTKFGARRLCRQIGQMGETAAEIHSDRSLAQRRRALEGFKSGEFRVLVATDIAARGIDVKGITLVINYDLPDQAEDYVHRIGRTGRAGMEGRAISFATPDERREVISIENIIRRAIPISPLPPDLPPERFSPKDRGGFQSEGGERRSRGGYGGSRGGFRGGRREGGYEGGREGGREGSRGGFRGSRAPRRFDHTPRPEGDGTFAAAAPRAYGERKFQDRGPRREGGFRGSRGPSRGPGGAHGGRAGGRGGRRKPSWLTPEPKLKAPKGPKKFTGGMGLDGPSF